jgi:predicted MFS family arabinose efflux permease
LRDIAGVAAGNVLAFYDFVIFSFFSPQIGKAFFPSDSPHASLQMALGAFGVGFVMRPVGALLIGRLGDRVGRKPAMLLTFAMMGIGVIGLALTPGYRALGIWAPVLAVMFRLLEGLALGGDMGPATAWLIEMAPIDRKGLFVSAQYAAQDFAVLLAGCVGLALSCLLSPPEIDQWGWRLAFLLGGAVLPVGIMLRRVLPEPMGRRETAPVHGGVPSATRVAVGFVLLASSTVASYKSCLSGGLCAGHPGAADTVRFCGNGDRWSGRRHCRSGVRLAQRPFRAACRHVRRVARPVCDDAAEFRLHGRLPQPVCRYGCSGGAGGLTEPWGECDLDLDCGDDAKIHPVSDRLDHLCRHRHAVREFHSGRSDMADRANRQPACTRAIYDHCHRARARSDLRDAGGQDTGHRVEVCRPILSDSVRAGAALR